MELKTQRYTSYFLNKEKLNLLKEIDDNNISLKNEISLCVFNNLKELYYGGTKFSFVTNHKNDISKSEYIKSWNQQDLFFEVVTMYQNAIDKHKSNNSFIVSNGYKAKYYKKRTRHHKKGDIKDYSINKIKTDFSSLLNYIKYVKKENINKCKQEIIEKYNHYCEKFSEKRIWNLINLKKKNILNKIHLINFNTGTWSVAYKANGSTINSDFIIDNKNKKYKYFFKIDTRKGNIFIPLEINKKYHKLDEINKTSWKIKYINNKVTILSTINKKEQHFKEYNNVVGIDLNVKHNFCSLSNGTEYDYDRTWIKKLVKIMNKIPFGKEMKENEKKRIGKLCRQNEWCFKLLIHDILDELEKQDITDIVMEDLSNFSSTFIKDKEFEIKYSKLTRLLRLSNIKMWFKEQAEKRGIRVHLTSPCYTSQQCPICGTIDKNNRPNQETFHCINCGYEDNADHNASVNIVNRYKNVSYKEILHSLDNKNRMISKIGYRKKEVVKDILLEYFQPL